MTATPPKSSSSSSRNLEDDQLVVARGAEEEEGDSNKEANGETDSQKKWDCKRCTYSNYPSAQLCTMCRQMRPVMSNRRAATSCSDDLMIKASTSEYSDGSRTESSSGSHQQRHQSSPAAAAAAAVAVAVASSSPKKVSPISSSNSSSSSSSSSTSPVIEQSSSSSTSNLRSIDPAERRWPCPACTFENVLQASYCSICSQQRPAIYTEEVRQLKTKCAESNLLDPEHMERINKALRKWSCSLCTFKNWPNVKTCTMCRTPRQKESAVSGSVEDDSELRAVAKDVSNTMVMGAETRLSPFEEKISLFDRYLVHLERSADTGCYAFLEALAAFMQPGNENGDKFVNYIYEYGESNRRVTAFECALVSGFDDEQQCPYNHTLLELLNERRQESMNDVMPTLFIFTNNHFVDFPGTDVNELSTCIYENIRAKIRDDYDMRRIVNTGEHFTLPVEVYNMKPWLTTGANRLRVFMDFDERQIMKTICFGDTLSVDNLLGANVYAPVLLCNRGGGHSLVDAASQAMWGVLDQHDYLRDAIYHTLCMKESIFRNRWATSLLKMGMKLDVWLMERCWASIMDCHEPGTAMEQIHVLVLAQVLNRPIVVLPMESARLYLRRPSATIRRATLKHPFEGFYPQLPSMNSYRCCSPLFLAFSNGSFYALVLPSQQPKSLAIKYDHHHHQQQQQQPTSPARSNGPSAAQNATSLNRMTTTATATDQDTNKTGHNLNENSNQSAHAKRNEGVVRRLEEDEEDEVKQRQRRLIHRHVLCPCNELQDYVQFAFDRAEAERFVRDGMWYDEDDETGT
ncbi:unnamed protein product, partial [Anisakis simplex]|uniref:Ubiquitin thioesterase ZRANB1 (inferred by orthology to a human protein) n=1 Tax=Anisakis simplex TaxID=6269 RepID=A0A0M3K0V1_ANISI